MENEKFKMAAIVDWIRRFSFKLLKNECKGVLGSLITISKSKMKNSKWRPWWIKFDAFSPNCTKIRMGRFSRSLITIFQSESRNSKRRPLLKKFGFLKFKLHKNTHGRVFEVDIKKNEIGDSIWRMFSNKFKVFCLDRMRTKNTKNTRN